MREGDRLDLQGDEFATKIDPRADERATDDHASTISMFEFELAVVEAVEIETPNCLVIHSSLTSFACPPDHIVKEDIE